MNRHEELENFVRIVDAGSITGAAEHSRLAKSAVSRRLKELEERLGVQLIVRSTRKLALTDTGQALYQRAQILLADWAETEAVVSETKMALTGSIRISAPMSFGIAHLSPAILDFMKAHPEIKIDIDYTDRTVDLVADGIDLAIRVGDLPDSSLIARKLSDASTVVVVSPALFQAAELPQKPDDLIGLKECAYGYRRSSTWQYVSPEGKKGQIELETALLATNGEFLCDATAAGIGVLKIPRFIAYEHIRKGTLVEILSDYEWPELSVHALYHPTRHLSARLRALVDYLADRFKGVPYWEI